MRKIKKWPEKFIQTKLNVPEQFDRERQVRGVTLTLLLPNVAHTIKSSWLMLTTVLRSKKKKAKSIPRKTNSTSFCFSIRTSFIFTFFQTAPSGSF